jgi:hypothetical protein
MDEPDIVSYIAAFIDDVSVLYQCMQVSWMWLECFSHNSIWKRVAKTFPDYSRLLCRYRASGLSWKEICRERLSEVFMQQEMMIGDRAAPEARIVFKLAGTGEMYIDAFVMQNRCISDLPHRLANMQQLPKVVDISTCDPFVLVLDVIGNVWEFVFPPSWDHKWAEVSTPRNLSITDGVDRVFAMDFACFALSNGRVWTWSIIDHPMPLMVAEHERENIATPPVQLVGLEPFWIYYIESTDHGLTRMYYETRSFVNADNRDTFRHPNDVRTIYPDRTVRYHDIPNEQIMALISQSIWSDDMISQIVEQMQPGLH